MTDTIDQETVQEPQEALETPQETPQETVDAPEQQDGPEDAQEAQETFPREYVEKLRQENGKYRQRAQEADDLAHRLHTALVTATGRLADPEDLPFADEHLEDADALNTAISDLLQRKPHLASRRPRGDVGQGRSSDPSTTVDLAAMLRSRA